MVQNCSFISLYFVFFRKESFWKKMGPFGWMFSRLGLLFSTVATVRCVEGYSSSSAAPEWGWEKASRTGSIFFKFMIYISNSPKIYCLEWSLKPWKPYKIPCLSHGWGSWILLQVTANSLSLLRSPGYGREPDIDASPASIQSPIHPPAVPSLAAKP